MDRVTKFSLAAFVLLTSFSAFSWDMSDIKVNSILRPSAQGHEQGVTLTCYQGPRVEVLPDDNLQHGYICKKSYGIFTYKISCTRQEVTQTGLTTIGEEKSFFYLNETENGGWRKLPKKTVNYQIEVEVEPELLGHVDNYVFEGLVNGKQSTCIFPATSK